MNIGILEICSKNHYNLINSWIKVLAYKNHNVSLYLTDDIIVDENACIKHICLMGKDDSAIKYLKKIRKDIRKNCDILIITSLQTKWFELLFFFPPVKTFITIHNARTWFNGNKFSCINIIKRFFRFVWKKRSEAIIVNSSNMKQYIESIYSEKKIYVMPFHCFSNENSCYIPNAHFNIIIPGVISKLRKEYDDILNAAQILKNKINITFLGSPLESEGGLDVLKKIEYLKDKYSVHISYFDKFIPPKIFNYELSKADLIMACIKPTFLRYDYNETYGITKDTGVSYAMVTHALPGIFNIEFKNLKELSTSTLYYSNVNELVKTINELIKNKEKYLLLRSAAEKNSMQFSVEEISKRITFC